MNILNPNYDMRGNALSCTKEGPLPVVRIVPGKLALVGNILETRPIGKEQCQVCGQYTMADIAQNLKRVSLVFITNFYS